MSLHGIPQRNGNDGKKREFGFFYRFQLKTLDNAVIKMAKHLLGRELSTRSRINRSALSPDPAVKKEASSSKFQLKVSIIAARLAAEPT